MRALFAFMPQEDATLVLGLSLFKRDRERKKDGQRRTYGLVSVCVQDCLTLVKETGQIMMDMYH